MVIYPGMGNAFGRKRISLLSIGGGFDLCGCCAKKYKAYSDPLIAGVFD